MLPFKVGDLVIQRDGDQPMKVQRIGAEKQGHTTVTCTWFVAGSQQEASFLPGQLRHYKPELPEVANPPLGS